jgi:hypothetical protein
MSPLLVMFAAAGLLVACAYKRNVYDPQTRAAERYGVDLDRRR